MSKRPLDHARTPAASRARRFAQIERETAPPGQHRASRTLHRRPRGHDAGLRTGQFLRAARQGAQTV